MKYPRYKIFLAVVDFLLVRGSFSLALQLRGISKVHGDQWMGYIGSAEFTFFFFYSAIIVLIFQYHNLYKIHVVLSRIRQLVAIGASLFYAGIGLAALAFFVRSAWIIDSRLALGYFVLISFLLVAVFRTVVFRTLYVALGKWGLLRRNAAIVGATIGGKNLAIKFEIEGGYGIHVAGFIDDQFQPGDRIFERYINLGTIAEIPALVKKHDISILFVAVSEIAHHRLFEIIDICRKSGATVKVVSGLFDVVHRKVDVEKYFDVPVVRADDVGLSSGSLLLKRIFDILTSGIALVVLSLPLGLIALAIKLTSKGPVLHTQVRLGKDARPFHFYKFRTMEVGSENDLDRIERMKLFIASGKSGPNGDSKIINEKRVTRIGRFLRKTSIDEIPQLLNVLKGDMSLVGPRPCLPYEFDAYKEWHKRRLSVIPGCTGLWQVSSRSEGGFDDMVLLDLYYIDNQSPWLDLQLILKTIPVMMFGRGAR